ncbi:unnamed protein product [Thlaspi arvense]|uniref:Flavin-containing monooxygenase n=1 Tax=Thlaspi arvense TaxID=13288 RepID=A0AAU9S7A8_THLAR|nr:unnamed protein product [Thlaspi arvense]
MATSSSLKREWVPVPIIVGAGPSGLATAACLKERGVPGLILERADCIASLWRHKTYDRLRLHLPKRYCELPLMPFPRISQTIPRNNSLFPTWSPMQHGSGWTGFQQDVATGENAEEVLPRIEGISEFIGPIVHTSNYKSGEGFRGKKVLVVGCGNSGMEVCLDLCNYDAQPSIVVRDSVHVLPQEIFGRSTFGLSMWLLKWFPMRVVDHFLLLMSRLMLGNIARLGLTRPKLGPLELKSLTGKTPVLDVGTLDKIRRGSIKVCKGIKRLKRQSVEFVDGRVENFDAIILATGYKSNVPTWLKEDKFFSEKDGFPRKPYPFGWKGENGLYAVGFTKRGLLGTSLDARRIAQDIEQQWKDRPSNLRHHIIEIKAFRD